MSLYNHQIPEISDDRCPITAAEFEDVWVYSNDRGWYWRVDYLCAGPFASEAFAFAHAANVAKKYAETRCDPESTS